MATTGPAQIVPSGKGFYLREPLGLDAPGAVKLARDIGASWVACHGGHRSAQRALIAAGVDVWLYELVGPWTVDQWRTTLPRLEAQALAIGAKGVIADPENTWPTASAEEWRALAAALGTTRRKGLGVGVTTHDGLRTKVATHLAPILGPLGCWVSPQAYDHELGASLDLAGRRIAKWQAQPWPVVPSIGSWFDAGPDDIASFTGYFRNLPAYRAACVFYENTPTPAQRGVLRAIWKVAQVGPLVTVVAVAVAVLACVGAAKL